MLSLPSPPILLHEPGGLSQGQWFYSMPKTSPSGAIRACELADKAEGSPGAQGRTMHVHPYPVVVAGVEAPVCFQPLATGNPIAGLSMKEAGACTSVPGALLAAQCTGLGALHSLWALGEALGVLGVDVDVHAVCAAAALCAHHGQPVAFGEGKGNQQGKMSSGEGSALEHTNHGRKGQFCVAQWGNFSLNDVDTSWSYTGLLHTQFSELCSHHH